MFEQIQERRLAGGLPRAPAPGKALPANRFKKFVRGERGFTRPPIQQNPPEAGSFSEEIQRQQALLNE